MYYAIVDIETTGGYASAGAITEIAIIVTDGVKIIEQYETLINPQREIPYFITKLTGIDNAMVNDAPTFDEVAPMVFNILNGNIFVAHNVNFDFSFVNHQLKENGYTLNCQKLCTVRYGKKVITGLRSYSLGNFCKSIGIIVENRHRAGGDCMATYYLLKKIFAEDKNNELDKLLKNKTKEKNLPLQVDKENYHNLPSGIGVYYFLDAKEKIIYIGKAINIKKRIASHFAGNAISKQRQEFIRNIASIKCTLVATELMSLILESSEIKKYWPKYNKSQKNFEHQYAIYYYEDQNGYMRLCVDKKKKNLPFVITVKNEVDGLIKLRKMVEENKLCPKFCQVPYIIPEKEICICNGICENSTSSKLYNKIVQKAIKEIQKNTASFIIKDIGMDEKEYSIIVVQKGDFVGMGYAPINIKINKYKEVENYIELYKPNQYINNLVHHYAEIKKEFVVHF
jgi:DNA polymerase III subunit epsilon